MALAFVVINLTHTFVLYRSGCRDIKICFPLHVINVVNTSKVHCCPPGEICAPVTRTTRVVDTETSHGGQFKIKPRTLVNLRRNGARLEVQTVNVVETELHQHCAVLINKHKTRRRAGWIDLEMCSTNGGDIGSFARIQTTKHDQLLVGTFTTHSKSCRD